MRERDGHGCRLHARIAKRGKDRSPTQGMVVAVKNLMLDFCRPLREIVYASRCCNIDESKASLHDFGLEMKDTSCLFNVLHSDG